jgi:CRP/FNR family cyclic AMP-dependent transcriptional regulator
MTLRDELKKVDLFRTLPDSVLDEVIQGGTTLSKQPGSTVVEQGSTDAGFHLILDGSARVSVNGAPRALIGPGDYFGEMSLIDSAPRSATVTAGPEGVKTFAISTLTFSGLMDSNPQMVRDLVGVLTARIRAIEATPASGW